MRQARREAVDVLEQLMRQSPNIQQTSRPYVPKSKAKNLTPEEKQMMRLYLSSQP